jgi:three-Cys-motif partner protein
MPTQLALFDLPPVETRYQHLFRLRYPLWTEHKAKMIATYLRLFVYVTRHGAYIDGFAGPQQPGMLDLWTAKLVLDSQPRPPKRRLNQFFLCELSRTKWPALDGLVQEHHDTKHHPIALYKGDFNTAVHEILGSGSIKEKTAAFCLLDQHTFECHWSTVQALARAKTTGMKIELFYFVPTGWLKRSIAAVKDKETVVGAWWGRPDWQQLKRISEQNCANKFCERFQTELGYKFAHAWPIYEKRDGIKVMYFMVHATDHEEAPKLMGRAYRGATGQVNEHQLTLDLPGN